VTNDFHIVVHRTSLLKKYYSHCRSCIM